MTAEALELEQQLAQQKVALFERQFGEEYRLLAYYAALPLVLTPELVHYLRVEFLQSEVPWEAEADLLLSELCSQVGYELYAMDMAVRAYLMREMEMDGRVPAGAKQQVAQVLMSYVSWLSRVQPGQRLKELEVQRWAAMGLLGKDSCDRLVAELAERFEVSGSLGDRRSLRAEWARLAQIVEAMEPQLEQYPELLRFASVAGQGVRNVERLSVAERQQVFEVGGQRLSVMGTLVPVVSEPELWAGLPLREFEFEEGRLLPELSDMPPQAPSNRAPDVPPRSQGPRELRREPFERPRGIPMRRPRSQGPRELRREAYAFEVARLEVVQTGTRQGFDVRRLLGGGQPKTEIVIRREPRESWQFVESLAKGLTLDLVEIPGGTFLMGAAADELESYDDERPQHEVRVSGFLLGKYPVTQAQWRFVAGLPQVSQELQPEPSRFKGDERPVEQVSWDDAQEFCARLSVHTGRIYRLPSEAEWEYACRAGTTTPFHFGETIDAEIANYQAQDEKYEGKTYPGKYGRGQFGKYRKKTIDVGSLNAANDWGLHHMHGNVWEWCQDHWHGSYEGAPTDGSSWIDETPSEKESRLLRGGSWFRYPRYCRSACRFYYAPGTRDFDLGFRVLLVSART